MLAQWRSCVWSLLLGLGVFMPLCSTQSRGKETGREGVTLGLETEQVGPTASEAEAQPPSPNSCGVTFHIPWPGRSCAAATTPASPLASQEDLDHLKISLEDTGGVLRTLQEATALEAGKSRYQDIVSEVLPDVREANVELHEILGKVLQELESHIQAEDHAHGEDEKKKLKEHLRMMDHMLQVTGHLAEQLDQASQNLLLTLTDPSEKPSALLSAAALQPP
ncbi:uncharacterized protein LOC134397275 isoform X2 [Elgaria multicarinata webbii]|uniref:uncharacterized protein LOC134397275 isoform X2 n=1 Tax=Elgaria multicarinata webbii TaxID=159646 RepID=UPI002FCD0164